MIARCHTLIVHLLYVYSMLYLRNFFSRGCFRLDLSRAQTLRVCTGTQEGCHFDVSTQRAVLGELRSELDRRGFTEVEIAASDETSYTLALSTWEGLGEEQEKVDLVQVRVAKIKNISTLHLI